MEQCIGGSKQRMYSQEEEYRKCFTHFYIPTVPLMVGPSWRGYFCIYEFRYDRGFNRSPRSLNTKKDLWAGETVPGRTENIQPITYSPISTQTQNAERTENVRRVCAEFSRHRLDAVCFVWKQVNVNALCGGRVTTRAVRRSA